MVNLHDYYSQDIYLAHHGIKGQKWGVRRYQNPDGTLTELGKKKASYRRIRNDEKNYIKSHEKYDHKKVDKYLVDKYGKERIDAFNKSKDKRNKITTGVMIVATIIASPIVIPASIITAKIFGDKIKKENPDVYFSNPDVQRMEELKKKKEKEAKENSNG